MSAIGAICGRSLLADDSDEVPLRVLRHKLVDDDGDEPLLSASVEAAADAVVAVVVVLGNSD